ncbi:hypothetical protein P4669_12960, partial [Priestia megaterium]|uniref:hypothetical protein n=2 Tax=Priestia megaterium TaxID=1404 RepID=UPI002E1D885F|nr:hypothetical protein [Priestia megaterium]
WLKEEWVSILPFYINKKGRRDYMQQNQSAKENAGFTEKPAASTTNAQKVKQEIQRDVSEGQGAMTSREAGAMRD